MHSRLLIIVEQRDGEGRISKIHSTRIALETSTSSPVSPLGIWADIASIRLTSSKESPKEKIAEKKIQKIISKTAKYQALSLGIEPNGGVEPPTL